MNIKRLTGCLVLGGSATTQFQDLTAAVSSVDRTSSGHFHLQFCSFFFHLSVHGVEREKCTFLKIHGQKHALIFASNRPDSINSETVF